MSTRFYYGQKDYIVQLNAMDDIATASQTSAAASAAAAAATLANVVHVDTATQGLTTTQQANGRANIAAAPTASPSFTGDVTFATQGSRFITDFTDATLSNRFSFQTSIANGFTSVAVRPNGSGASAQINTFNSSDMGNSSYMSAGTDVSACFLNSKVSGTGTLLPIAFRVNSTEIARFDTSGNFGVGSTPSYRMHVQADSASADTWVASKNATAAGTLGGGFIAVAGSSGYYGTFKARANGDVECFTGASNPGALLLGTAATERVRIDINGNFGLGQTAPSKYTHGGSARVLELLNTDTAANSQAHAIMSSSCTGASSAIGTVSFVMPSISATNKIMAYIGAGSDSTHTSAAPSSILYFGTRTAGGAVNQNMTLDGSGNLGIGVTPSAKLHVAGKTVHGVLGTSGQYAVTHMPDTLGSTVFSWKNSSDAFTLLTGGDPYSSPVERLRVNSSGRLGLSTSGPNTLLELRTDSNTDGPVITLNNRGTGNTTNTNNYIAGGIWGAAYRDVRDPAYIAGIDFLRNSSTSGLASDGNIVFYTSSGGDTLANVRPGSERARIDSSGNLLVGTTTSNGTDKLQVNGSATVGGFSVAFPGTSANAIQRASIFSGTDASSNEVRLQLNPITGNTASQGTYIGAARNGTSYNSSLTLGTADVERARIDANGNLMIGTTTQANGVSKVTIAASSNGAAITVNGKSSSNVAPDIELSRSSTATGVGQGTAIQFSDTGTNTNSRLIQAGAGSMQFFGYGGGAWAEHARIDIGGNLLLNTTSALALAGRMAIKYTGGATQYGIVLQPGTDSTHAIEFLNAAGTSVGSVVTTASATTYNTTSDYRLKEDVQPMVGALDTVMGLKPVTYRWKADGSAGEGFIAHELGEQIPLAVSGVKDAVRDDGSPMYQSIDTSKVVAHLVAALQELKRDFDAYKASHP